MTIPSLLLRHVSQVFPILALSLPCTVTVQSLFADDTKAKDKPTGIIKIVPQKDDSRQEDIERNQPQAEAEVSGKEQEGAVGSVTIQLRLHPENKAVADKPQAGEIKITPAQVTSAKVTPAKDASRQIRATAVPDKLGSLMRGIQQQVRQYRGSSAEAGQFRDSSETPVVGQQIESVESAPSRKLSDGDPGDPGDGEVTPLPSQPGDVPLEDEPHPFDAPAVETTGEEARFKSSGNLNPLNELEQRRNQRIVRTLDYFRTNQENVVRRGPWALMHTILPFGVETEIIAGSRKVNAIGWLCHNGLSAKQRIFQPTQTGFRLNVGPGVQGHEGQFLAILAQSHVSRDYPIQIGKRKYTIEDLIRYEMATCREKSELTFKLIAFSHYLEPDQVWRDNRGKSWNIEKLVAEELAQPINGAACGGTHRLMGLTCAVISRQEAGKPLSGHFLRADKFLNDFVEYTLTLQNPDGSFSTEWFERRGNQSDIERKVQTTGHITEWLVYTLPDQHLKSPPITQAIDFLLDCVGENPSRNWPIGPRGHALRALSLYQKRVFQSQTLSPQTNLAKPSIDRMKKR